MDSPPEHQPLLHHNSNEPTPVYPIIRMVRGDVMKYIDTPLSLEALMGPDLTYTLVQPLVEKYLAIQADGNLSIAFCCLITRVHFLRDDNMTTVALSGSRAYLCEILATRIFRANANNLLNLTIALTTSWPVYSGADADIIAQAREERDDDLEERVGNAIEMAILGKAKYFIKSSACQKVITAIWSGKCVYSAESSHSILSDTYKRAPVHFYDPHKAPLLDHYRLKVPAIRAVLDYLNFIILFILFVVALEFKRDDTLNASELLFMIYGFGFTLEKFAAMQEHGIKVYFKGTWNGFDLAFITTFCIYAFLRIYGLYHNNERAYMLGIDVLALIACLMFPRLAFVTFKDSLLVLSLRAMIVQFTLLMMIAAFCFLGFLYALWTLSRDNANYSSGLIAWWMLDLWFGLDAAGFDNATKFHPIFGPVLMVTYACLSNTLLLTVLVSILSNTFASVNEDAAAEAMFRKAIATIEGVKADFLFSYQPPVNLVALCILLPVSYILSPRWFHKFNVFLIRLTSFPILIGISFYERQSKIAGTLTFYDTVAHMAEKVFDTLPRSLKRMTIFEGLAGAEADIDVIFELEEESALDTTGETNDDISIQNGRQPSHSSMRRLSGASSRRGRTGHPQPPSKTSPHTRLNTLIGRVNDVNTFSPLAQVYNPLLAHDLAHDDHNRDPLIHGSPSAAQAISYGPASRRRLTSILSTQQRPSLDTFGQSSHRPSRIVSGQETSSPPQYGIPPRSRSQDPPHSARNPISAQEVKDMEDDTGENPEQITVMSRLDNIERQQAKIESLLLEISKNVNRSHAYG
ncbi:hypothetical protein BDN70DRAFT_874905 [Pholiota conissans]|uniref:Calcium channel YVC1 n=1 Tax=Pholiota conissans TaxID=109636 RepID=A0A9P5Z7S2_9AGAR|nr:hypothetical protein BDN70DRAFT_874905 [Pholiota conissans]